MIFFSFFLFDESIRAGKTSKYRYRSYIAVVTKVESDTIGVRFLKHVKGTCHTFVNPIVDDFSDVDREDIIKVL